MASVRPRIVALGSQKPALSEARTARPRVRLIASLRPRLNPNVTEKPDVALEPAGVPGLMRFHSGNKLRGDATFYVGDGFFDMDEFEAVTAIQSGTAYSLVVYSSVAPGAGSIVFTVRSNAAATALTATLTGAERKKKVSIPAGVVFPDEAETCLEVVRSGGVPDAKASGSVKLTPD